MEAKRAPRRPNSELRPADEILLRALPALLFLFFAQRAVATHNEAGQIVLCHTNGLGYSVTITTWTNPNSQADRPEFEFAWGDGDIDTIPRLSQTLETLAGVPVNVNLYVATHTYSGPGVYTVEYQDPNRVAGVINIPNSVNVPMCVQSQLIVTPWGDDCLPDFLNPPIQNACLHHPWIHNPGAYDIDGDSLSYETMTCLGFNCDPIPDYQFPDEVTPGPNNNYSMDPNTGTITWDSPQASGVYNIAFIVKEWRNGVMIGWVERDMQVIVGTCNDEPPTIDPLPDLCVVAGTNISFSVHAHDPDAGQTVTLSASGGPFTLSDNPATFPTVTGNGSVNGTFTWHTNCSHVRLQPWQVVFQASDDFFPVLQNYQTTHITVVAPAPLNPTATPNTSVMQLHWDPDVCTNAIGYKIYRRQGGYGFVHGPCETGVPAYTGYQFIAQTAGLNTTNYDDHGLNYGVTYCYMVVAFFPDSAKSYASVEFCNMLQRDVPIMTNVSVIATDNTLGEDTVKWSNAWDLDTLQHPGPYRFKLYKGSGFNTANTLINTGALSTVFQNTDTTFSNTDIDTRTNANVYRVELFDHGGDSLVGSSNTASSVFIVADPNDQKITLHINYVTPWINDTFQVYRKILNVFTYIGSTTTTQYVDSGLINGELYCYYVKSFGAYDDTTIGVPLINNSEEVCAMPIDLTPPCPPVLAIDTNCVELINTLTWTDPDHSCADDVYHYNIYYTDSLGGPLLLIATITGAEDTVFTHVNGNSVAGCYEVTAIDTSGNESLVSNMVCADNCPLYVLPNVFTPNSDQVNDLFIPFPYRGVKEIDLHIFNRWGNLVFKSADPAILWDGTLQGKGAVVSDGVYFYTCLVTFVRLAGPEMIQLKGYVHVLRGSNGNLN